MTNDAPTTNDATGDQPPARERRLDLGRCFNDAFELYQKNFPVLFLAAVITEVVSIFTLMILAGPLVGGWVLMILRAWERDNRKVVIGDLFGAFDRFGPLLGMFFLSLAAIFPGLLLLVLPGLYLMTVWSFNMALLADRRMGVLEAFGASYRAVTRRDFWGVLLLTVIGSALAIVPALVPFVGIVLGWLVMPVLYGTWMSAYVQLVREAEETP